MSDELARLAVHVRAERERAKTRDDLLTALRAQILRQGCVIISREVLWEAFPHPDQTENFFLATGGCRPIPSVRDQLDTWCRINGFEVRQRPSEGYMHAVVIMLKAPSAARP